MGGCCAKRRGANNRGGGTGLFRMMANRNTEQIREEIMAYNKTHAVHQILDQEDFTEQLQTAGSKLVVVDFFAVWCGPCRAVGPVFEKLAVDMTDMVFLKLDVDHLEEIASENNVTVMPTFVIFLEGQRVGDISGGDVEKLKAFLNEKNKIPRQLAPAPAAPAAVSAPASAPANAPANAPAAPAPAPASAQATTAAAAAPAKTSPAGPTPAKTSPAGPTPAKTAATGPAPD